MENMSKTEQASAIEEVKEVLRKLGLLENEIQEVLHDLQLEDDGFDALKEQKSYF